ncbi:hypothetical protein BSL78_11682 [Apostichopus japonicus]|uniref:Integrase core domain-containing protein n=1 Tax=Stichopus japonicus TaxID=307972 RepID=A0A2G8KTV8_STIJA|nr:hypothetical protein BSL78_11682 [Apostichopus japonicus]
MDRDRLIRQYFSMGLPYAEIQAMLAFENDIVISNRHLRRQLKRLGLARRKRHADLADVVEFLEREIQSSGQCHGYRWMHLKCLQSGLNIDKETIRIALSVLDPIGVAIRSRRRLYRRAYHANGPNFIWHADGYDKLKPFGIGINGCIDGFSRKLIWCEAYKTNNDPTVIAGYFIEAVDRRGGFPFLIRTDMGTENRTMEQMQLFFHRNIPNSVGFIYGTSTHNQRIEFFWGILRKECIQFWMNVFHHIKDDGYFTGDDIDRNLMQFCFLRRVQDDIDHVAEQWNCHRIRPLRNNITVHGRPVVMYSCPELYGTRDYLHRVEPLEVLVCREECTFKGEFPCDEDFFHLCCILMEENNLQEPSSPFDAVTLYLNLRNILRLELNG